MNQVLKKLETDEEFEVLIDELNGYDIQNWEMTEVLWFIRKNYSWRADMFAVHGYNQKTSFNEEDLKGLEFDQDGLIDIGSGAFGSRNPDQYKNWKMIGEWLRDIVFAKDKLDLGILKMVTWNHGDEGGPGIAIALEEQETHGISIEDEWNEKGFWETIVFGMQPKKVYYFGTVCI